MICIVVHNIPIVQLMKRLSKKEKKKEKSELREGLWSLEESFVYFIIDKFIWCKCQ